MRIFYNRFLPSKGFTAMAFFGVILARNESNPLDSITINHEEIHAEQARDCGGWLPYYIVYLWFTVRYGYSSNPFEREAYAKENDTDYRYIREKFQWKQFKNK
jgi:hypothetical protein